MQSIRSKVSAFASRVIQADCLANPEMRRSNSAKSRGDFRRIKEDYSQYKCTIAVVYDPQHPLSGSEEWQEVFRTIGIALNAQSYWIKEVVSLPLCKVGGKVPMSAFKYPNRLAPVPVSDCEPIVEAEALNVLNKKPLIIIHIGEHQINLKAKDKSVDGNCNNKS